MRTLLALLLIFMTANASTTPVPLDVGALAPVMTVITDAGTPLNLADAYKNATVLIYFYPKADTPGCTVQACNLRDNMKLLNDAGVTVLGVSRDPVGVQARFKAKYGLNFPLIADNSFALNSAFGTLGRNTFIVRNGTIVWRDLTPKVGSQAQDALAALAKLKK